MNAENPYQSPTASLVHDEGRHTGDTRGLRAAGRLLLLNAVISAVFAATFGLALRVLDPWQRNFMFVALITTISFVSFAASSVSGFAILARMSWVRPWAITAAGASLPLMPIGTLIGLFVLDKVLRNSLDAYLKEFSHNIDAHDLSTLKPEELDRLERMAGEHES